MRERKRGLTKTPASVINRTKVEKTVAWYPENLLREDDDDYPHLAVSS